MIQRSDTVVMISRSLRCKRVVLGDTAGSFVCLEHQAVPSVRDSEGEPLLDISRRCQLND